MDNWAISTPNTPAGLKLYREIVHFILDLFELHSYFLKLSKCMFEQDHINFLGFQICAGVLILTPSRSTVYVNGLKISKARRRSINSLALLGINAPSL